MRGEDPNTSGRSPTLLRVWSDITVSTPTLCSPKAGWCAQRPGVDALRVSASSRAVPAALLQCHPVAILETVGGASEAPRLTRALPLPLPRFLAALGGARCSYLSAVPGRAGRGAAAALGCDPGGFTSGSRSAGVGSGRPGWGRQGRYLPAGGVWRLGPLGCHATHAFLRSPPPLGSTPLSLDLLRVLSDRRPFGAARPPRGAGRRGRQEGRAVKPQARG